MIDQFCLVPAVSNYDLNGSGCVIKTDGRFVAAHPTAQASSLAWHPVKKILVVGWDSGELYLYANQQCSKVDSSHNASVHLAQFSAQGNSLVTADKNGTIVGWKTDTSSAARLDMREG